MKAAFTVSVGAVSGAAPSGQLSERLSRKGCPVGGQKAHLGKSFFFQCCAKEKWTPRAAAFTKPDVGPHSGLLRWVMEVMILCEAGNFEHGVPGHVVESSLGWLKTGDSVGFQVAQNGTTWVQHHGHDYQFALHGLSDVVEEKQVFLLAIVN